jgi:hypothetical protein
MTKRKNKYEQRAWDMMVESQKIRTELILSPGLWFAVGICWGLAIGHAVAAPIEHQFKSPSFNGVNQSSHYLTIENQETSRKDALKQEIEDAANKQSVIQIILRKLSLYETLRVEYTQPYQDR